MCLCSVLAIPSAGMHLVFLLNCVLNVVFPFRSLLVASMHFDRQTERGKLSARHWNFRPPSGITPSDLLTMPRWTVMYYCGCVVLIPTGHDGEL